MIEEPDLLARGDDLATRLQQKSRGHVIYDATMRKMSDAASLMGEPLVMDDRDARAGLEFARDATTVRRLMEAANAGGPPLPSWRDALTVGVGGAVVMLLALSGLALMILKYRLAPILMLPIFLGGPLLGWALTVMLQRWRGGRGA